MLKRSLCQNLKFSGPKCTHNTGHVHCPATAYTGQIEQSGFKNSYLEFYNSEWGVFYVYGKLRHRDTIVKEGLLPSSLIFEPRIAEQASPSSLPLCRPCCPKMTFCMKMILMWFMSPTWYLDYLCRYLILFAWKYRNLMMNVESYECMYACKGNECAWEACNVYEYIECIFL